MLNKNKISEIIAFVGILEILVNFFLVSRAGFFTGDDFTGMDRITTMKDNFDDVKELYMSWGGRLFPWFLSNIYIRILDNKIWLDINNTVFFGLLLLLGALLTVECKLKNRSFFFIALLYTTLIWLLCPSPAASLFWAAGSSCYLWPTTFAVLYLWLFYHFKDQNFPLWKSIGLCLISAFSAMNEIPCIAICCALLVYCIVNWKQLNKTTWFLMIGFVIGSAICVLAPGNFFRTETSNGGAPIFSMLIKMISPLRVGAELAKFKALWLLVVGLVAYWLYDKTKVRQWCRDNYFILTACVASAISCVFLFSMFNDSTRYLVYSETFAIILFVKLLVDLYPQTKRISSKMKRIVAEGVLTMLFVICIIDASSAIAETRRMHEANDSLMTEICKADGVLALDVPGSHHRMAYAPSFPKWTWEPIAYKLNLDSVHVYPSYCLDKYWGEPLPSGAGFYVINSIDGELGEVIIRHPEGLFPNGVDCIISYDRPKKWFRVWYNRLTHYQYTRISEVSKGAPDFCYEGYCYYEFYMKSENCKGVTDVSVVSAGM